MRHIMVIGWDSDQKIRGIDGEDGTEYFEAVTRAATHLVQDLVDNECILVQVQVSGPYGDPEK